MKSQHKIKRNRFAFEQLENRQLLAGNVTADATTVPGTLVIVGDNSANVLVLTQVSPGMIKVTPAGTKLNGSNSAQTFTVTNGIYIDMGGGSDSLTLKNMTVPGADVSNNAGLAILMGSGNDALVMSNVVVRDGICAIDTGDGSDATAIDKCTFDESFYIDTGNGTNAVAITRSTTYGQFVVLGGSGVDAVTLVSDTVIGSDGINMQATPAIDAGTEIDNIYDTLADDFEDLSLEIDGPYIETYGGVDVVTLTGVNFDGVTEIYTDAGNDAVTIVNSTFGNPPTVSVEVTPDTPSVGTIDFSGLCIETDIGSDAVTIVNTTVYGFLQIDTSGDIDCPIEELSCCSGTVSTVQPAQNESGIADGNDAVALNNVKVLESAAAEECCECCQCIENWCETNSQTLTPQEVNWACCVCECLTEESVLESGMLLIYTGNQVDAVALNKVTTDAETDIYTTDESSLDGADAVVITNSSFNQNNEVMYYTTLPLVETGDGLYIETGCGNDAVTIAKVNVVGEADIETGAGTDAVAINALVADDIFVDLGSGKYDVLTIAKSVANTETFDGAGTTSGDTLVYKHLGNNFANPPDISGFQYVV